MFFNQRMIKLLEININEIQSFLESEFPNIELNLHQTGSNDFIITHQNFGVVSDINEVCLDINELDLLNDDIKNVLYCIQARNSIFRKVINAIMEIQKEYFLTGNLFDIVPMKLETISNKTGMDVSIISRSLKDKFIETPHRTIDASFLLSENLYGVSDKRLYTIIVDIIQDEDKKNPFSDIKIKELISDKYSINIVRESVRNYRERLNIPNSFQRKVK